MPDGDPSSRLLRGLPMVNSSWLDMVPCTLEIFFSLSSSWTPYPAILVAILGKLYYVSGIGNFLSLPVFIETVSIFVFFLGFLLIYFAIYPFLGSLFSGLVLFLSLSSVVVINYNYTLMTEIMVLFLLSSHIYVISCGIITQKMRYYIFSALFLLFASMIRTEVIIFAIATSVWLFWVIFRENSVKKSLYCSVSYFALTGSYTILRFLLLPFIGPSQGHFASFWEQYDWHSYSHSFVLVWKMLERVWNYDHIILIIILALSTFYLVLYLISVKDKRTKFSNSFCSFSVFLFVSFLLSFLFIMYLLFSAKINDQPRYLTTSIVFLFLTISFLWRILYSHCQGIVKQVYNYSFILVVLLLALVAIDVNLTHLNQSANQLTKEEDVIKWLNLSSHKHHPVIFDISWHRELPMQLYTTNFSDEIKTFTGWGYRPSIQSTKYHSKTKNFKTRLIYAAHDFVYYFTPKYAVLTTHDRYLWIQNTRWDTFTKGGRPNSYFHPYLSKSNGASEHRFSSPYFPAKSPVIFDLVYKNERYQIYKLTYVIPNCIQDDFNTNFPRDFFAHR